MKVGYLIGSLRNPQIPEIAFSLRQENLNIFDDWFAAGRIADDSWRDYELGRGHGYNEALQGHAARHVFSFDKFYLNRAHYGILALPAGRSGHLEAGWLAGQGKPVWLLLEDGAAPERLDVMTQFLTGVVSSKAELITAINSFSWPKLPEMPKVLVDDALWLAGLLEGEGSFSIGKGVTPRLLLQMTDRDIVARAAAVFGSRVWTVAKLESRKTVWACGRSGLAAIEWMRILRPELGTRRQQQILDTTRKWLDRRKYNTADKGIWLKWFGINKQGVVDGR